MAEQRRQHPRVEPSARFPESGIDLVRSVKIETQLLARELALIDEHANLLASSSDNHAVAHLLRVRRADRHQAEHEDYRPSVVGYLFDHGYHDPLSAQRPGSGAVGERPTRRTTTSQHARRRLQPVVRQLANF